METIKLDLSGVKKFVSEKTIEELGKEAKEANISLENGTGKGSDYLGWLNLPSSITSKNISVIVNAARVFRVKCEVIVVVGIGGSYLGAKAVIEALSGAFDMFGMERPPVVFAGHNVSEDYLSNLTMFLFRKRFGIINISKSGTTTEPAITFRVLKNQLERLVGKDEAAGRIIAITDEKHGSLRALADSEGYKTFIIPDNIGGRFSVFTPVGLIPIAMAGKDVTKLIEGAADMEKATSAEVPFENNMAEQYAAVRNVLYRAGKKIEILANFNPQLHFIAEWWKQLYGESEGKEGKGIFNAAVDFTSDLHSMGQWIQEGERTIFETVLSVKETKFLINIPEDSGNLDGLNYLAGKRVGFVNEMAEKGTKIAHIDGGVPNIRIEMPKLNEYFLGQLLYFFERACGISGYLLNVNPFDQPGVEAYKRNMFALLGKPGYEDIKV